jgi:hypothetical protein
VAVLSHREVTLHKVAEGSVKVKSMCLAIIEELVLQVLPYVACGVATLPNDLLKISCDCVGEPVEDDSVHPSPRRIIGERVVGEDMVSQGVLCQGYQHQVTLDGVVGGHSVQHNVHQLVNVCYRCCLNVEVGDE